VNVTDIKEKSVSIAFSIKNAYIDSSKMTVSFIVISIDVIRGGTPVLGTGSTQTAVMHKADYCAIGLSSDKLPIQRNEAVYNILTWPFPFRTFSFCYEHILPVISVKILHYDH